MSCSYVCTIRKSVFKKYKSCYNEIVSKRGERDGKINSTDLLVLQRHILEIEKLKGVYKKVYERTV